MMLRSVQCLCLTVILWNKLFVSSFLVSDGLQRVLTNVGEIVGHTENVKFDGKTVQVSKYLGIPYAEPPVGNLRFRKPVPLKSIQSPFPAHSYGPMCLQQVVQPGAFPRSEDCLYLNIFVPGQSGLLMRPVMVWIHGGAFVYGGANSYRADVLSTYTDVIVVTVNYRLGPIGFFSTHDDHAPGNFGVWDQHEAIKWVYENIAAFGGDTSNITIFGESAGSSSVVYQLMYPGNDKLFKRAIAESGSIDGWAVTTKEDNYNGSLTFASILGCNQHSHKELLVCIRSKKQSDVESAVSRYEKNITNYIKPTWTPVLDGDFVITDPLKILDDALDPLHASKYGSFRNKDLLIGANNYDGGLLPKFLFGISNLSTPISDASLASDLIPGLIKFIYRKEAPKVVVDAIINEYKDYTGAVDNIGSFIRMSTDSALNAPLVKTTNAHTKMNVANTFVYQFSVSPPMRSIQLPKYWSDLPNAANHADDIMYVFGFPYVRVNVNPSPADLRVSKFMMTAWANFARSG